MHVYHAKVNVSFTVSLTLCWHLGRMVSSPSTPVLSPITGEVAMMVSREKGIP